MMKSSKEEKYQKMLKQTSKEKRQINKGDSLISKKIKEIAKIE